MRKHLNQFYILKVHNSLGYKYTELPNAMHKHHLSAMDI